MSETVESKGLVCGAEHKSYLVRKCQREAGHAPDFHHYHSGSKCHSWKVGGRSDGGFIRGECDDCKHRKDHHHGRGRGFDGCSLCRINLRSPICLQTFEEDRRYV